MKRECAIADLVGRRRNVWDQAVPGLVMGRNQERWLQRMANLAKDVLWHRTPRACTWRAIHCVSLLNAACFFLLCARLLFEQTQMEHQDAHLSEIGQSASRLGDIRCEASWSTSGGARTGEEAQLICSFNLSWVLAPSCHVLKCARADCQT